MTARHRFATRPTPGARHDADAIARLARVLGRPFMPWQYQVERIKTERRLDDPTRYRYRLVIVSVPRQSGKTTDDHVSSCHYSITNPRRQSFYTAQTGKDARERWLDAKAMVEDSPLGRFVVDGNKYGGAIRLAAGNAAIVWPNGAQHRPFAPTAGSLHGYTPDRVTEDEVWAYDELQGQALDGAIGPAQITLPHAQRVMYSTMGDADSTYWHALVDEGRAATEDPDAEIGYVEYSAPPGADLYDPAVWAAFHPAIGHTIDLADLAAEARRQPEGTWQRAYCNLRTATRETTVDMAAFELLGDAELRLVGKGSTIAYDVSHDSGQATVTLARPIGEDSVGVRVVKSAEGVTWVPDFVIDLADKLGAEHVHADDGGPTRDVTETINRRRPGLVQTTTGAQLATATGAWLRRCKDGRLTWDKTDVMRDAMAAAVTRPMGDAVAFSRAKSAGSIDALIAGAVAIRAALLEPAPIGKPRVSFG